jgi:peptidyl-prolyl cis-trans isomerase D
MLISKFNKLIHNKIIWAGFAILISLAMVGMFAPSGGRKNRPANNNSAGTLFGSPISRNAFNQAGLFNRKFQPRHSANEADTERQNEETWQRLALLQLAKQLNITVSNSELNENIQRDPSFSENGVFNRLRYKALIEQQMRVRVTTFEEYLRQEIILRKMSTMVTQSIWIAPYEVERSVARLTDLFSVIIVDVPYSNSVNDIEASDADVRAFYDEHKNTFEIPEMRSVKYVEWPVSNYLADITVSEESIRDYYDDNIEKYSSADTNGTVTYQAIEEVTNSIRTDLAHHKAIGIASEEAMQFTDDIIDMVDSEKDDISIEKIAASRKCTVQTTAMFSADGPVPGLDVADRFTSAAFRLSSDDPEDSFSHAIVTDNAIYVLAINKTEEPSIPPFKDVKKEAEKYADSLAKSTAFNEKAESIRKQIEKIAADGGDITEYADKNGLKIRKPKPFSVYEASINNEDIAAIAPAIIRMNKGQVSDPVPTEDGVSIIYVADRQPGDFALAESLKPEAARTIQSTRIQAHFATWAKSILDEARAVK